MDSFIIEFSRQQLEILNGVLIEMPFKLAQPLIGHINVQIKQQLEAAEKED